MKLIDADELVEILDEEYRKDKSISKLLLISFAKQILSDAPTVEAELIRHRRWILSEDRFWKTCPGCGAEVDVSMGLGIFVDGIEVDEMNYCPNCGSKMDLPKPMVYPQVEGITPTVVKMGEVEE